jgi:PIN domain nuclease of toxin-antitoxin system
MGPPVGDTHVVLWYLSAVHLLSPAALAWLRSAESIGAPIYVSTISLIETSYVVEKNRIPRTSRENLYRALNDPASLLVPFPVGLEVAEAVVRIPRDLVPDMPDRIIAATALHLGLPLITRDEKIRAANIQTVW